MHGELRGQCKPVNVSRVLAIYAGKGFARNKILREVDVGFRFDRYCEGAHLRIATQGGPLKRKRIQGKSCYCLRLGFVLVVYHVLKFRNMLLELEKS